MKPRIVYDVIAVTKHRQAVCLQHNSCIYYCHKKIQWLKPSGRRSSFNDNNVNKCFSFLLLNYPWIEECEIKYFETIHVCTILYRVLRTFMCITLNMKQTIEQSSFSGGFLLVVSLRCLDVVRTGSHRGWKHTRWSEDIQRCERNSHQRYRLISLIVTNNFNLKRAANGYI